MNLSEYAIKNKLNNIQLAKLIGRDRSVIGKYRKGTVMPKPKTIMHIEVVTKGAVKLRDWNY